MRALIQRVSSAAVRSGAATDSIGPGLVILLGVRRGDTPADAAWLARKCAGLRICQDAQDRMNVSLLETGGEALVVSQFTLYGDADRGRRPSFVEAAPPEEAEPLYAAFVRALEAEGVPRVATGVFQAMMTVTLANEGPVTILVDSRTPGGQPGAGDATPAAAAGAAAPVGGECAPVGAAPVADVAELGRLIYSDHQPLVLASASPRRAELLARAGIPFTAAPVEVDETVDGRDDPRAAALRLARLKAAAAVPRWPGRWILGADTVVDLHGRSLGKPVDDADARLMLADLSGREHRVHTGLVLVTPAGEFHAAVETTRVVFRDLVAEEIAAYVATGEPRDKAGAYGIQGVGGLLVDRIDGSYDNVIGLPLNCLIALLKEAGS